MSQFDSNAANSSATNNKTAVVVSTQNVSETESKGKMIWKAVKQAALSATVTAAGTILVAIGNTCMSFNNTTK